VEPDVRDDVVETMQEYTEKTGIPLNRLLRHAGLRRSKYYEWNRRYGLENRHNGNVPKANWLFEHEKEAIIDYAKKNPEEGYRRLTYRMIDDDVVYATPSSVYRVLRAAGLLRKYSVAKNKTKGLGYAQPNGPHREWHIDISYVNILGTFLFLVAIIDGYSRYVVHHELRAAMEEKDVQLVVQRALERFAGSKPRIISDRGSQFIAKDFKEFIRYAGVSHTFTSVGYPQSNGKIERFFRTAKTSCIRRQSFLSVQDARAQLNAFVHHYNHTRLHSAIRYVTPFDRLVGKDGEIIKTRESKLLEARRLRVEYHLKTTLDPDVVLSDSR
jgi:transposase InsO family protein